MTIILGTTNVSVFEGAAAVFSVTHDLGHGRAANDGSFDEIVELPKGTRSGVGQMLADSEAGSATEYDRAWFLTATKKKRN